MIASLHHEAVAREVSNLLFAELNNLPGCTKQLANGLSFQGIINGIKADGPHTLSDPHHHIGVVNGLSPVLDCLVGTEGTPFKAIIAAKLMEELLVCPRADCCKRHFVSMIKHHTSCALQEDSFILFT
jgi:hypothetical protein